MIPKKGIKIFVLVLIIMTVVALKLPAQAFNLQKWFEKEAMRLYLEMESTNPGLSPYNRVTPQEIHDRVFCRIYYSEHFNYLCPEIDPLKVSVDILVITSHESYWVKWKNLDGGKSFGTGSMRWSTAKWLAEDVFGWDWRKDKYLLGHSDRMQAKYMVAYYYWLLSHYNGNRHTAIAAYNAGSSLKPGEEKEHPYFKKIMNLLSKYENMWKKLDIKL